jgi:hypothetical protein
MPAPCWPVHRTCLAAPQLPRLLKSRRPGAASAAQPSLTAPAPAAAAPGHRGVPQRRVGAGHQGLAVGPCGGALRCGCTGGICWACTSL